MVRHLVLFLLLLNLFFTSFSQQPSPARFRDLVFKNVLVQKNILYRSTISKDIKHKYYRLDFYEPAADSILNRPIIIWMHGGGFKFGTKTTRGTPIWSKTFAQRGYVCAAINYRLSKKRPLARFPDLAEGCYDAIEDLRAALQFLKNNYRQYRIDTNRIVLAGNSAGSMIALQACYSNTSALLKLISHTDSTTIYPLHNPIKIAAIINFWGALFDINWLENSDVPVVSVHGSKDRVVPFAGNGPLFGTAAIHKRADLLHITNDLKIYAGYGHELQKHFIPFFAGSKVKRRWLEAGQFAADFLYKALFENKEQKN
jgi:acetyl esterase/lipase